MSMYCESYTVQFLFLMIRVIKKVNIVTASECLRDGDSITGINYLSEES